MHRPVAGKDAAQRTKPGVGIRQMVKHAGADDLIELLAERGDLLDREPTEIQIWQVVCSLKHPRMAEARFADVDSRHVRVGLAHCLDGSL
jgi:hypothetical protein